MRTAPRDRCCGHAGLADRPPPLGRRHPVGSEGAALAKLFPARL